MVQHIPVDTVIIALPSILYHRSNLCQPVTLPGHERRQLLPMVSVHCPNSAESCQSSQLAFLPKPLPPRTLLASRAPDSRPGCTPSRRSVALTLCQFWRSVGVSPSLLVMAWCRARIITNVQSGAKTTDPSKTRQGPAVGNVPASAESCRPTLLHPAGQVAATDVPCWNRCKTVRFRHGGRPAKPVNARRSVHWGPCLRATIGTSIALCIAKPSCRSHRSKLELEQVSPWVHAIVQLDPGYGPKGVLRPRCQYMMARLT